MLNTLHKIVNLINEENDDDINYLLFRPLKLERYLKKNPIFYY